MDFISPWLPNGMCATGTRDVTNTPWLFLGQAALGWDSRWCSGCSCNEDSSVLFGRRSEVPYSPLGTDTFLLSAPSIRPPRVWPPLECVQAIHSPRPPPPRVCIYALAIWIAYVIVNKYFDAGDFFSLPPHSPSLPTLPWCSSHWQCPAQQPVFVSDEGDGKGDMLRSCPAQALSKALEHDPQLQLAASLTIANIQQPLAHYWTPHSITLALITLSARFWSSQNTPEGVRKREGLGWCYINV